MSNSRKTKIVATLGPASSSPSVIRELLANGLNVARFNFSHGNAESHSIVLDILRDQAKLQNRTVATLQDLSGPKLRIGKIAGDQRTLRSGEYLLIKHYRSDAITEPSSLILTVDTFVPEEVILPGHKILLADGRVELVAREVSSRGVSAEVLCGGSIRSHVGINLPDSDLKLPAVTAKDLEDVTWAIRNKVDYVALSYVSSASDVLTIRRAILDRGGQCRVIAKIENRSAVEAIDEILAVADGVMVARGDLGLQIPLQEVPRAQREIVRSARKSGKPVITATQMLLSLVLETRPTRAEVSDIYTAVMEGTDAVMLSEETAIGQHPPLVLEVMDRILVEAEKDVQGFYPTLGKPEVAEGQKGVGTIHDTIADAIAFATQQASDRLNAAAVLVFTESGHSAKLISQYRPRSPTYVVTPNQSVHSELALYWGIEPTADFTDASCDVTAITSGLNLPAGAPVVVMRGRNNTQALATLEVY